MGVAAVGVAAAGVAAAGVAAAGSRRCPGRRGAAATVMVGAFAGAASPARRDTAHAAVDLDLGRGGAVVPLEPSFELQGEVTVGDRVLAPGRLGYLGTGRDEMAVGAGGLARVLLIGGVPFPEPVLMWWNYVARSRAEILAAHRAWTEGSARFGDLASPLPRITVGPPPWSAARR